MSQRWQRTMKVAQFFSLLTTGVLAGLLFEFWAFTAPALATLPGPAFAQVTQAIDRQYLVPIPYLYILVNLTGLAVLLLMVRARRTIGIALTGAALVATLMATASTLLINVPINGQVLNTWSATAPPADWAAVRDRWDQAHAFRTAMVLAAFVCGLLAAFSDPSGRRRAGGLARIAADDDRVIEDGEHDQLQDGGASRIPD